VKRSDKTIGPETARIENRQEALDALAIIEAAAEQNDLPFVVSAVGLIRDAIEREAI
jgi:hypothetical protein